MDILSPETLKLLKEPAVKEAMDRLLAGAESPIVVTLPTGKRIRVKKIE